MGSKVCMNDLCGTSIAGEGKRGWALRCGFANLCHNCGTAYEQFSFCDLFHSKDTGWRDCALCGKHLHCGCIASSSLIDLLDSGGISCISCRKASETQSNSSDEKPKELGILVDNTIGLTRSSSMESQNNGDSDQVVLEQLEVAADALGQSCSHSSDESDRSLTKSQMKVEKIFHLGDVGTTSTSNMKESAVELVHAVNSEMQRECTGVKNVYGSLVQTNLTIAIAAPSGNSALAPGTGIEEIESSKIMSTFQLGSWSPHILPKAPKPFLDQGLDTNGPTNSQMRIARPPVEGRVKNQLLPRYWPRITEQELQQISGESNSTILPLFEKVLSASDAGRIGRLVLPKACAEAYFPQISQPEGLPLRIQDIKGKEWVFQFRFWPNNNSRMYVLEGVTPCIQSMQLQAGDTVTFSRMDPGGKLLMGFRRATTAVSVQSWKPRSDSQLSALSTQLCSSTGDSNCYMNEKHGVRAIDASLSPSMLISEKKRSRTIGSKSKRLVIDCVESLKLKHTWDELQDMLCPPNNIKPSTVTIEDHEFEEYEDPPVFGKGSIFTINSSGERQQWAQCDCCFRWRRFPVDFLLPPKWECKENFWDTSRCSCNAPDELSPMELESLLKMAKDFEKWRLSSSDNISEPASTPVATTTKHPRHRPGCTCIVCIQPPSGKGKHKPTCICNVCMTVKRRFKTLMLRKKKRQSERAAEIAQKMNNSLCDPREEAEGATPTSRIFDYSEPKGHLDLNICPHRDGDSNRSTRLSMMGLLQMASLPLETYLKQNGLTSLVSEQQASSGSQALPQATKESSGLDEEGGGEGELPGAVQSQVNSS